MNTYVVDANVAIKWFVPEIYQEAARRLRQSDYVLQVPDFLFLEFGLARVKTTNNLLPIQLP